MAISLDTLDDPKSIDLDKTPEVEEHGTIYGGHPIPFVEETKGDEDSIDSQFQEPIASPSVVGEENVFSGDSPIGEPADIDDELSKVGLSGDDDGPRRLGE